MNFGIEINGLESLETAIKDILSIVPENTIAALSEIGLTVEGAAKRSIMEHQSSGAVRKVGKREFVASLPGYAPNSQHGAAGFVGTIQNFVDETDLAVVIGTNDPRGAWFEMGTTHMEPRPWLLPAVEQNRSKIVEIISKALKAGLER